MTFIALVVGNTIDYYSLAEFEQVKCIILVDIVDIAIFMIFGAKLVTNWPFCEQWAPKMQIYDLYNACSQKYYWLVQFSGISGISGI